MFENIKDGDIYKNLFNGKWIPSETKNTIEIHSPWDNSLVGKIQAMSKQEVDESIENSNICQKSWADVPIFERAKLLHKAADLLMEKADILSNILQCEIAKDCKSSYSEIERSADFIRFTADEGKHLEGEAISGESFPGSTRNKISFVSRVPVGTVLAISPFNYPVNLSVSKIAPALIAGNSVILKPPTKGSISALYLAAIFNEAGLPPGVLNTITGKGSDIGDYIVTHSGIDFINFTGSTEVGKHIANITGMIPMLLELGGKDAAIVLNDADLKESSKNIVSGAFSYSGQRCTAVKRVLVENKIADRLIEEIKSNVLNLKVGTPQSGAEITPLIDNEAADYVEDLITDAIRKGAKAVIPFKREKNLLYPTLLDLVTTDMRIAWEEPFGPVLPIIRVNSIDEAIEICNESKYGLQAAVFTKDINSAFKIANKLDVGGVQINHKTERGPDNFPFTAVKSSGLGTQGIKYSIESMTRRKSIIINL